LHRGGGAGGRHLMALPLLILALPLALLALLRARLLL
jgi:hypothetical protein